MLSSQSFRYKFSEEAEAPDEEKEITSPIFASSNPNYGEGVCKMSVCHGEQTSWACVRPESYRNASENPGGGTPYNGLYGEAPPERGTFFRLQV